MDRERLDGWCQKAILGLVLLLLIFGPLATGAVRPQDFLVIQGLTVLVLLLWVARFWINPKHRLYWPPVCWGVLAFTLYAIGRYATSEIEFVARQELIRILVYAFLFFAIIHNLHNQETTQVIALTVIFLAMGISMYAIYQFLTGSDHVWNFVRPETYGKRGSGTYICPNHLAGYLGMVLPLALAFTLTGRFKPLTKVFLGYATLVIFAAIFSTVSRGGWVAVGVSLIVFLGWAISQRSYRIHGLIVLVMMLVASLFFFSKSRFSFNRYDRMSVTRQIEDVRFMLWKSVWKMCQDNIVWGVGPAHFDERFPQYRPAHYALQARPGRVHNDYLNTLVDWGAVGTGLVVTAWGLFFGTLLFSWRYLNRSSNELTSKRSNKSSLVLGGSLGLVAILVHSFFDYNMHIPANAIMAITLMALITGFFRFASDRYWVTPKAVVRLVISLTLLAGSVYLGIQGNQRSRELFYLLRAEDLPSCSEEQMASFKAALTIEPKNFETASKIGECYRLLSWLGDPEFRELAENAMIWFEKSHSLHPYDPYNLLRHGMCLDWIQEHEKAGAFFEEGLRLDPNGYYANALMGWHLIQTENYARAKEWLERSLRLYSEGNTIAGFYWDLADRKLKETPSP